MKFLALIPLIVIGAAPVLQETITPEVPELPDIGHYDGSFPEGMHEIVRLTEGGNPDQAFVISEELLSGTRYSSLRTWVTEHTWQPLDVCFAALDGPLRWLGFRTRTTAERGQVHYARGLVFEELEGPGGPSFELARQSAGYGEIRGAAIYNLGTLRLRKGEVQRAEIPEISGVPPLPPTPGAEEPPDPLKEARRHYKAARRHFVERLRYDWQDADTRANVELVIRRLRELDEIEQQREEQEGEEEENPDENQESESEEENPEDQESEEEQETPEDAEPPENAEPEEGEQQPPEEEEEALTTEQLQRLLQRLEAHEKDGERVRNELRRASAGRVRRDW